jgi:hypothetical protein
MSAPLRGSDYAELVYNVLKVHGGASDCVEIVGLIARTGVWVTANDVRAGLAYEKAHQGQLPGNRPLLITYHGMGYRRQRPAEASLHGTFAPRGSPRCTARNAPPVG